MPDRPSVEPDRDPEGRPSGRDETEDERLDRNLGELLQELRVALPGVQVLFAFLLAVPFQQHFSSISEFDKRAYFATLLLTAISAALLIAPSAYHRLTFRYQQKGRLVFVANRLSIAGLVDAGAGDDLRDHARHQRPLRHRRDHGGDDGAGADDVRRALGGAAAEAPAQCTGMRGCRS